MIVNKGMCPPMSDRDFYNLLTDNSKTNIDMILSYYPELIQFVKIEDITDI